LLKPTSGDIWVNQNHTIKDNKKIYYDIGIVFELPNLYMKATVEKNLQMFSKIYNLLPSRVNEVMEDLQLLENKDIKVEKLSRGWKQRVLIARALLHKPKILILDEPTSGLDPNTTTLIHNYLRRINKKGTTIIVTTHDMNEADDICNRIGIINNGEIAAIGSSDELKSIYQKNEVIIEYMENDTVIKNNLNIDNADERNQISKLNDEKRLVSMNKHKVTLADVFFAMTGGELS